MGWFHPPSTRHTASPCRSTSPLAIFGSAHHLARQLASVLRPFSVICRSALQSIPCPCARHVSLTRSLPTCAPLRWRDPSRDLAAIDCLGGTLAHDAGPSAYAIAPRSGQTFDSAVLKRRPPPFARCWEPSHFNALAAWVPTDFWKATCSRPAKRFVRNHQRREGPVSLAPAPSSQKCSPGVTVRSNTTHFSPLNH